MARTAKMIDPRLITLRKHLQWALEVEHFTIPPYLCTLYSIAEGTNSVSTAVIQSVAMEEMLHMALVANLLNAVGGKPRIIEPVYPAPLPHITLEKPSGAGKPGHAEGPIPLQKFSPAAIAVFMAIERPIARSKSSDGEFHSIGQFYDAVRKELRDLLKGKAKLTPAEVFTGNSAHQIDPDYYYGGAGRLLRIENIKDAELAIEEIVDQGEGLHGKVFEKRFNQAVEFRADVHDQAEDDDRGVPHDTAHFARSTTRPVPAHYFRFREISVGRYYQAGDKAVCDASGEECMPTGPQLPVQWDAVYNMRPNPKACFYKPGTPIRRKLDDFNQCYTRFCQLLQSCFVGKPQLMAQTPAGMFEIRHRAIELMRIPDDPDQYDPKYPDSKDATIDNKLAANRTVGPSFEKYVAE
ncbi:MAG TPA: ferritin-like protein [Gemmataceae bacterium]|jgi:hypothetical protein|nr:ferritin-like protein [Gemmataceae bacterium]